MNIKQIEDNINKLTADFQNGEVKREDFIYEMMLAYGHRKSSVTRVRTGERNLATVEGEIHFKRHLYFKHSHPDSVHLDIDHMKNAKNVTRDKIRFVIATDFKQLLAIDTKTNDSLDIDLVDLPKHFDFFLPWADMEKAVYQGENPADVKAAEKMAKLFDLIRNDNFDESNEDDSAALHNLNVFLTRLLFCFFAEDTEIFQSNQFSHAIESHTKVNGIDVHEYLNRLFRVLNTDEIARQDLPEYLAKFPFVNGGLFADDIPTPKFSLKSRKILIECGSELDWSDINPDIFGSMIQAVVHPDQRGGMGMHYTSVTNIMKVIEPLFLNGLYEEFEKYDSSPKKLLCLLQRIGQIKIFDPACGSGNFLIIAYKEIRKLEMEVLKRIQEIEFTKTGQHLQSFSEIKLSQFYGIELDDFAHEVAILSLWLAEHQMNVEFKAEFGETLPTLPLKQAGNIISGNSNIIDWSKFCPLKGNNEVFVLGNPPYIGARNQTANQKTEMREVLLNLKGVNSLDYITLWFYKGAEYILKGASGVAFVSTNSITQGEQVSLFWPNILIKSEVIINFAHTSFKWSNNAKNKAGVTCVIIGMAKNSNSQRMLYDDDLCRLVKNISPYLTATNNVYIYKRKTPISNLPIMVYGNQPIEGGFLTLNQDEKNILLAQDKRIKKFVRPLTGGNEFLKGIKRWCIWINDDDLSEANSIEAIKDRINNVREFRKNGGQVASSLVERSHQFRYRHEATESFILLPCTSSEKRDYLQLGFYTADYLTTHSAQILNDADPFIFGVISSKAHMLWTKAVGGCLESRIRYSNLLCYNNFPFPIITETQKEHIRQHVYSVLEVREAHPEKNIADLYDPDKMPQDLLEAHASLDKAVNSCYEVKSFDLDEEHLSYLFKLYEEMTGGQNA